MPKDLRCKICVDAAATIAVREMRDKGNSIRDIAAPVKQSRSCIDRHLRHADVQKPGGPRARAGNRLTSQTGRCRACGLSMTASDAESLMRRAERLLWIAETIAAQAQEADDSRLALQAVDRARAALETMMRAIGMIGGDGTTIVINQQQKERMDLTRALEVLLVAMPGPMQVSALRWLQGWAAGEPVPPYSIEAKPIALPMTLENGTEIRDSESVAPS